MHISEQITALLEGQGWKENVTEQGQVFTKYVTFPELAGMISDGTRLVTLTICEHGRYLSRVDGWGKVERDVDLRDFPNNPQGAIDAVLKV